ncbi:BatA and WFA domain-containing protein [Candidatus Woesearchaeota archaeon]|nr:BatA and WFA domain-containing protein [Candidatus Woesearchaeota archaeon]
MISYKDPIGLYAFLLLIPFIILYLFSLKPKKQIFSSLMFFIKDLKKSRKNSFFRRLLTNLFLLLQFLIIFFLIFSSSSPQLEYAQNKTDEHIVIILDTSASMQAELDGSTRFGKSVDDAINLIENQKLVSLILAEEVPLVALERDSSDKASDLLKTLNPSESKSNIEDSMIQAMTLLNEGTVYVYSDFAFSEDLIAAKKQLNSKGIDVVFKPYNEPVTNFGIIDYDVYEDEVFIKIKNYNDEDRLIKISSEDETKELFLGSNSVKEIIFPLNEGKNTFKIETKDDFIPDNFLFVSIPKRDRIKTLYITNIQSKDYLKTALYSSNRLEIQEVNPPIIPEGKFELYIINDVDKSKLLPATFENIYRDVKDGSSVIVNLQKDSLDINYKNLEIFELEGLKDEQSTLIKNVNNQITTDVEFSEVTKYFDSTKIDCTKLVMARTQVPLICEKEVGKGHILLNGIVNDWSNFKNTPDYPIFWSSTLDYLFPEEEEEDVVFRTGEVIPIKYQFVQTPYGNFSTSKLIMNRVGFYNFNNQTISANLIDYDESNVNIQLDLESEVGTVVGRSSREAAKTDVAEYLVFFALVLVFIELFVIKWRGDL